MSVEERDAITVESFLGAQTMALMRVAYLLAGSKEAAEDLVQDTLTHLLRKWHRVSSAAQPEAYARRVMVNLFLTQRRRRHLVTVSLGESTESHATDHVGSRTPEDFIDKEYVRNALSRIPPRQRTALVLRYYLQLNDTEVAEAMHIQPSTARSTIARALEGMQAELQIS